jgi:hypothetical protein
MKEDNGMVKTPNTPTNGNRQTKMGVMIESYEKVKKAPMTGGTGAGKARGGGAALRGTRFSGVK